MGGVWPRRRVHPEGGVEGHPAVAAQGGGGRLPRRRIPRSGAMVSGLEHAISLRTSFQFIERIFLAAKQFPQTHLAFDRIPSTVAFVYPVPFCPCKLDHIHIFKAWHVNPPLTHERKELLAQLK